MSDTMKSVIMGLSVVAAAGAVAAPKLTVLECKGTRAGLFSDLGEHKTSSTDLPGSLYSADIAIIEDAQNKRSTALYKLFEGREAVVSNLKGLANEGKTSQGSYFGAQAYPVGVQVVKNVPLVPGHQEVITMSADFKEGTPYEAYSSWIMGDPTNTERMMKGSVHYRCMPVPRPKDPELERELMKRGFFRRESSVVKPTGKVKH